jgi:hypothetical protein
VRSVTASRPKQIATVELEAERRMRKEGSWSLPSGMGTISRERNWRILLAVCLNRPAIDFPRFLERRPILPRSPMSQHENGSHETSAVAL